MINFFLKYKTKKLVPLPPDIDDIKKSRKVLFSLFTRYGDTIICLVVIKEFIKLYPEKEYLILCPRQMKPYVSELMPDVECITINKRNAFEMFKVNRLLKNRIFDIGFNPWSNGLDSAYFISYCKKFQFYKDLSKPANVNHYQIVRMYLQLPEVGWFINDFNLKDNYKKILICPESTDVKRSISFKKTTSVINKLSSDYPNIDLTIATKEVNNYKLECDQFIFNKTAESSQNFIKLIQQSEIIVCCDSGPLHIANALKIPVLAFFEKTHPDVVMNSGSEVKLMN